MAEWMGNRIRSGFLGPAVGEQSRLRFGRHHANPIGDITTKLSSGGAAERKCVESLHAPPSAAAPCSAAHASNAGGDHSALHSLSRYRDHATIVFERQPTVGT